MAKKRKVHKRSLEKSVFSVYGTADFIKRIENTVGEIQEPLSRAYKKAVEPSINDIEKFMINHQRSGRTYQSFNRGSVKWTSDNFMEFRFGFDIDKGGYPALFLEYGTPKMKPTYFMHYAIENHRHEVEGLMTETLEEYLKEKGLM